MKSTTAFALLLHMLGLHKMRDAEYVMMEMRAIANGYMAASCSRAAKRFRTIEEDASWKFQFHSVLREFTGQIVDTDVLTN